MTAHWWSGGSTALEQNAHYIVPLVYQLAAVICICLFLLYMMGRGDK